MDFFNRVDTDYGIDNKGLNVIEDGIDRVVIPELQFQLSNEHLQQLRE